MRRSRALKLALKRGALVTAANWPLVAVQFVADAVFKTLVTVPVVGGVLLVVLLVGADPADLLRHDPREIVPTLAAVLLAQPVALAAFLGALALVLAGGSVLMFAVKSGTLAVLAEAEADAGPVEQPPLRLDAVRRASRFTLDRYTRGVRQFFPRFLRLGLWLLAAYLLCGFAYLAVLFGPFSEEAAANPWTAIAASTALVAAITLVNLVYLLLQMVMAADDVGLAKALGRVARFVRREAAGVAGVFAATLVLVVLATGASILAVTALGFIAFVPLVGLAALPLQLAAWLVRGLVFEFIGLTAVTAYLHLYRVSRQHTPSLRPPVRDVVPVG